MGAPTVLGVVLLALTLASVAAVAAPPRVLACFWGLDRAADVTFGGFQRFVLNVFDADLCAAVARQNADGSGTWHAAAKYLDVYDEPADYDARVPARSRAVALNSSLAHVLRDNFLYPTGIQQMYSKARIWRLIDDNGLLDTYEWFLLCRTDLVWLVPHVDFRGDATHSVWVPYAGRKSDWQGFYDRAVVVHKTHVQRVLTMMDTVTGEGTHPFLDALRGYPGSVGQSTNCESFYRQYLEFYGLPIKRFKSSAFVTATSKSFSRLRISQRNSDTGHTYKYTDEYVAALNNALDHYRHLDARPAADDDARAANVTVGSHRFYVVTIEQAERANRTLQNCALSAWGMAVYERLLSHPLRTKHVSQAHVVFASPHGAWDFHWPFFNGNRERNAARRDAHFPLPLEGGAYEPYGSSLATSCRTFFAPCGYEGCLPEFGQRHLRELLNAGEALSPEGMLAVLETLYRRLNLQPGRQFLVFYDSGPAGPFVYGNTTFAGGYDLPDRAYQDERFIFALANSLESRFRHGRDVSLPTPWTEDVLRYNVRTGVNRTYFLTFKGNFATSGPYGDVRRRARQVLHNPAEGIVIVDSNSTEGQSYDFRRLMYDTTFALILRGDQQYSYRYTEVVCCGAVPVMVASPGWVPPFSNLHAFSEYGILVQPEELATLLTVLRALTEEDIRRLRYAAKQFCLQHLITVHQQTDSMIESVLGQL